jgi:hypothetical protein
VPHVGEQFWDKDMLDHVYSHSVAMMLAAGAFCAGGILARHLNLWVAFVEGNCLGTTVPLSMDWSCSLRRHRCSTTSLSAQPSPT